MIAGFDVHFKVGSACVIWLVLLSHISLVVAWKE